MAKFWEEIEYHLVLSSEELAITRKALEEHLTRFESIPVRTFHNDRAQELLRALVVLITEYYASRNDDV